MDVTDKNFDLDYEADSEVDKYNLHNQWAEQTRLAYEYKKNWIYLKKKCQTAHEHVKVTRSELIEKANLDPVKCCHKAKPAAPDIEAYYRRHKDHKQAKKDFIDLEAERDLALAAMEEIAFTRKKAIENLSFLWRNEYYIDDNIPKPFEKSEMPQPPGMVRKKKK